MAKLQIEGFQFCLLCFLIFILRENNRVNMIKTRGKILNGIIYSFYGYLLSQIFLLRTFSGYAETDCLTFDV